MWIRLIRDKGAVCIFEENGVWNRSSDILKLFFLLFNLTTKLIVYWCENGHDRFLLNPYPYYAPQRRSRTEINYDRCQLFCMGVKLGR